MPDDPTPPSAPSADRLQRWHVEHLMAAAEPHVLTNPAAAAMLGWLAVTLSVIEQRDAAESRSAEDRSERETETLCSLHGEEWVEECLSCFGALKLRDAARLAPERGAEEETKP